MLRARILSFIGYYFITLWCRTIRITYVNRDIPDRLLAGGANVVYAFWHGRQLLLLHNYRNTGVVIPSSESRDGEIQTRILNKNGFEVVRGSSKRKGARALLGLVDGLRSGKSIALAVDGPRGPIYEVKQGVTYLAGKLNKPIVPVATSAKKYWVLEKIWDKYLLPVPFTRGVIAYGEPILVQGISSEELESKQLELQSALIRTTELADNYFKQ